jgi:thioredoxin-like negative regulator of GroEL|uniref:Thioredoxin domain-containing protein n=1 Tax=Eutreptiella gymnastica TaxID=73025 RepID=A0A7S4FDK7_9EUGL|mmetsp:Transcript_14120/g.25506  ORF Transcript_14120/g.25506 Transcript_14120/m.25506 type:complete len:150 (-) Transcript_14120:742-1191(-)|eukprot:CAMPEP_0174281148 /NCGR_PEP_ID=MMETSP0809-20121228/1509_1 /TAXON_ID=73025 ORGANISM="Eutreptiella gymnastica-like, Strain CCMP1594" /NCGR_SAMPLE_ID=MMETSP0809 /ASSEMBLY_ACC=CAM_ASM_000658 /LENGTH=149 /DNA_ID=CAMNT_0015374503 /DNA_START=39 /DNA_END=488 /DNA_ORIENTATION=-
MSDDGDNEVEESTRPLKVKDDEQFKQLVADPERLVVLVLVAPWCEICIAMQPQLEEIAQQPEYERVQFLTADVDAMPDIGRQFKLQSLPTIKYLLKGEEIVPGFSGSNVEKYKTFLEKAFNKRNEVMAEYDAAKAAQEEGGGGEEGEDD